MISGNEEAIESLKVRARFICSPEHKRYFHKSKCVIAISVDQPAHEFKKLASTVDLVNRSFQSCIVAVGDTLQRHTLQLGTQFSDDEIYKKSKLAGDSWLERNKSILERITIPHTILRWDDWLNHPEYEKNYEKFCDAYISDPTFVAAMDITINNFIERFSKRNIDKKISISDIKRASLKYLIEESVIIMMMWKKEKYNYIIYPSNILKIVEKTHERFVLPDHPELLNWVRVKLKTEYTQKVALE